MHKTVFNSDFSITQDDLKFDYQESLTKKLDSNSTDFDQNTLNEIVLWKVNRYAEFDTDLISLINSVKRDETKIDTDKTKLILRRLLNTNGVQLAMASTILRYRNPSIYQIIDQRVYRIIYENQELKLNTYLSEKNLNYQIDLYLKYLTELRKVCSDLDIPFDKSDRILFMADRRVNKEKKLKNY
ncbi:hypothetical protein [Polaribacter sp. HaHaR_3_91]|jgi:hypothetical protein|uniref:hypothetical protein n=1 Tax=Polaribacter sp. HaHaR_3_91 TaxID=2745561 RepID=UPI001C4ED746|nr:hypothetical protein [Polaribacter sp. HaHaR_3_91]QXP62346.1 hypothetical protein H0I27_10650 [Polaribacter sp. HaHaR_3_91]